LEIAKEIEKHLDDFAHLPKGEGKEDVREAVVVLVLEAIRKAGYRVVKARERNESSYALGSLGKLGCGRGKED